MAPPEPLAQSAPRPHPIRDLDLPGLGVAGVGAVLLLVAFSGIGWYRISGKNAGVGTMHKDAANHNAHLAYAFFGWLGWLLVAAAIVGSVLACLYTGRMRRLLLGPAALVLGVVGIGLTLAALQDLVDRAREQGYSVSVWLYNESGLYLALLGFALTGVAATLRPAWQLTRRLAAHTSQR
jgi:hypothetical protein